MALSTLKKWGWAMIVVGAASIVVGVFAAMGKIPPVVIYTVYGIVTMGLTAFGVITAAQPLPQPPSE